MPQPHPFGARGFVTLAPLAVVLFAGCDGATQPEPLDGLIEGSVVVEERALAGVEVHLMEEAGAPLIGITDASGAFSFEHLAEGRYDLRLGSVPDDVEFETAAGIATLDRTRPTARVDFVGVRKRDVVVSVRVVVEGTGIADLTVEISGPEVRSGRTGADGRVEFAHLLRGRYTVQVSGYDPRRLAFARTSGTVDAVGDGATEAAVQFMGTVVPRPPDPPGLFEAIPRDAYRIEMSWADRSDNEEVFEIERSVGTGDSWSPLTTPPAEATAAVDTSAVPATAYRYRLRACNVHGCSEPWLQADAATPDVPPPAPTDLAAGATGPGVVAVSWVDASSNETHFELERKEGSGGGWSAHASPAGGSTGFTDTGLRSAASYSYRLRACNDVGCSGFAGPVTTTTTVVPPASPTALSATALAYDRVSLHWTDASPDETEFRIERRTGGGPWGVLVAVAPGTESFIDGTVAGATSYRYRASACNSAGCSPPSAEAPVTTPDPPPNLDIATAYVVQRVQRSDGGVPLIAGLDGLLRIFPRADRPGIAATPVRVEIFQGGALIQTTTVAPPIAMMPTTLDESSLAASWNLPLPSSMLQPGLGLRLTVDPDASFAESDESDNNWPLTAGPVALDVRATPEFQVTFVPVRQSANGTVGDVTAGNAESYFAFSRRTMPFADDDFALHAEYTTDQPVLGSDGSGWSAVLSEIAALRSAEGGTRSYFGVVPTTYGSGVAGIGYVGWPVALGWDKAGSRASVAAHEWGHNFGRRHSPGCGAANPDTSYPHAAGQIGAWGFDLYAGTLKSPAVYYDLMTYCGPEWISDYVYERVLDFRGPASVASVGTAREVPSSIGTTAPVDGLLVWGRIEDGRLVLEPAFDVHAPAVLPGVPGRYRIEVHGGAETLLTLSFDPIPVADGPRGDGHFAFVVPIDAATRGRLTSLQLIDGGRRTVRTATPAQAPGGRPDAADALRVEAVGAGRVEVAWNAARHPIALVRDAATGEILTFGRSGSIRLAPRGAEVEVELSNGLATTESHRVRWR